jgi:hypothetical protein
LSDFLNCYQVQKAGPSPVESTPPFRATEDYTADSSAVFLTGQRPCPQVRNSPLAGQGEWKTARLVFFVLRGDDRFVPT